MTISVAVIGAGFAGIGAAIRLRTGASPIS